MMKVVLRGYAKGQMEISSKLAQSLYRITKTNALQGNVRTKDI